MDTGSIYFENPSILYLSGTSLGQIFIVGSDYVAYWVVRV